MLACPSWAQGNKKPTADTGGGGLEIANISGKLASLQAGNLKILDAAKVETTIVFNQNTSVKFTGQAKPAWLSQGLMVRLSARFDQQGNAQAPVKSMEVFTPEINRRMSPDELRNQTPGVYPEGSTLGTATKGLFNDKKKVEDKKGEKNTEKKTEKNTEKKTDKKGPGKSEPETTQGAASTFQGYRVVGRIMGMQKSSLMVNAGGQRLSVELDPNITINVTASNAVFAVPGDEVKVSGLRNPQQPQFVQAESVEIKAAKPLGADGSQGPKNARNSKNAKAADTAAAKGKKGAEKTDPKTSLKPEKKGK